MALPTSRVCSPLCHAFTAVSWVGSQHCYRLIQRHTAGIGSGYRRRGCGAVMTLARQSGVNVVSGAGQHQQHRRTTAVAVFAPVIDPDYLTL